MTPTQPLVAEIPQVLQEALEDYLKQHPDWSQNRVLAAALALFLLQNADGDRRASKVYLEALFRPSAMEEDDSMGMAIADEDGDIASEAPEVSETSDVMAPAPQPSATPTTA